MKIEDGKGTGKKAGVTEDQRLQTSARASTRSYYASRDDGQVYTWTSTYSATSGDEILYIKNDSTTKFLYIDHITVSAAAGAWTMTLAEVSGTAAGTTVTGKNLNLRSGNVADSTALGNASVTGLTIGNTMDISAGVAGESHRIDLNGTVILGLNDAIAITFTGTNGTATAVAFGYFE